MRLVRLSIAGFRGFPRAVEFDLDADAVILTGVNGSGKTSFFDALLWLFSGTVPRLGSEPETLVNRYSLTGEARAEAVIRAVDGKEYQVARRFDGEVHLSVREVGGSTATGRAAESLLLDLMWPDAKSATDPWDTLTRALTRATYLQQDLVRDFVEADVEQDRFATVGELVGMGRVAELQRQVESSRLGWSRATNSLVKELEPLQAQLNALQERLVRLGGDAEVIGVGDSSDRWLRAAVEQLPGSSIDRDHPVSATDMDRTLRELQLEEQREYMRLDALRRLNEHLARPVAPVPDTDPLMRAIELNEIHVREAASRLELARRVAANDRRRVVGVQERSANLRSLAELALRLIDGPTCPVCGQVHDSAATRGRLEELLTSSDARESLDEGIQQEVLSAAEAAEAAERSYADSVEHMRAARRVVEARRSWEVEAVALSSASGLSFDSLDESAVEQAIDAAEVRLTDLRNLRARGERLSLQSARTAEVAQRLELEKQIGSLVAQIASQQRVIVERQRVGEVASALLAALREASSDVVATELERIEPLLQRMYSTVDPHPSFRAVSFLTRTVRGRGRLWTRIGDDTANVVIDEPSRVLSSSQLNVLAVATFLSLNLGARSLPLQVIALDDPLQSLDTVNLLGLADLLRRVRVFRQVIVSTHDQKLAALLERKLRPVLPHERTCRIDLQGWTPQGPSIHQREVRADVTPLRLVASA